MSKITINGKTYTGRSITSNRNNITIDNSDIALSETEKEIWITVIGGIDNLQVDTAGKIAVTRNVNTFSTMSGDVEVTKDIHGNVKTMSRDVKSILIPGSVSTMSGSIKTK